MPQTSAELIVEWRTSVTGVPAAGDEAAYRELWDASAAGASSSWAMALLGGACADRLSWLFLAGYQGAVRAAFALETSGWLAFIASEDRGEEDPLPGVSVSIAGGIERLNGYKTWVAAVEHVDELVVLVGPRESARLFRVERQRPGLELSARPRAGFLGAMSQGHAAFRDLELRGDDELAPITLRDFPLYEASHLYAAFAGFLATRAWLADGAARAAPLLELTDQLAATGVTSRAGIGLLKQLDEAVQRQAAALVPDAEANVPDWAADARLLAMYSKGIGRR